jgi:hypothetical protein
MLWDERLPLLGHDDWPAEEGSISFNLVAIDLGERSFHLHAVSDEGIVLSKKSAVPSHSRRVLSMHLRPSQWRYVQAPSFGTVFSRCGSSGAASALCYVVRTGIKGSTNDAVDAEAI